MRGEDPEYESAASFRYECSNCGDLVVAESHPGSCPDCDVSYRNRSMPFE